MARINMSARIDIRYLAAILPYLHEWGLNPRSKSDLLNDCFRALHAILEHNHGEVELPSAVDAISLLASHGFTWEKGDKAEEVRLAVQTETSLPPIVPRSEVRPTAGDELDDFAQRLVQEHKKRKP